MRQAYYGGICVLGSEGPISQFFPAPEDRFHHFGFLVSRRADRVHRVPNPSERGVPRGSNAWHVLQTGHVTLVNISLTLCAPYGRPLGASIPRLASSALTWRNDSPRAR